MKKFLVWCFIVTIAASVNLQAEVADLQERVGEYKSVEASRQLSDQEKMDLKELLSELEDLRAALGQLGTRN